MRKKKVPLVCIIIVNWNGGEVMRDCIKSLKKTAYKNYKVLVVDNGSKDRAEVENLKKINKKIEIVYLDKNYGYTIGTNAGYKYSIEKHNPDYICEMNNDIITIDKNWLEIQIKELEKTKENGISSGKLVFPDGRVQAFSKENDKGFFELDNGQYDYIKEVPFLRGGCMIVKRAVVNKIGYPDENFFFGPNDIDYCYRAGKAGFKVIYNGFAKSIHLAGYSSASHEKDWIFLPQTEGMLIFYLRYNGLMYGLLISLRFFVRAIVSRKIPNTPINFGNLIYHKTFPKRIMLFFIALISALKKHKRIKQNSQTRILKKWNSTDNNEKFSNKSPS